MSSTHQSPIHPGGLQGPSWALWQTDAIRENPFPLREKELEEQVVFKRTILTCWSKSAQNMGNGI